MSGRRSDGDGWAVQGPQLVCRQQGVQGDHRVGTNETRGDARTQEEGLGCDGGSMDHMQAKGGGLERSRRPHTEGT